MERFGQYEQEPFRTEAFITRNRKGEFLWYIKVYQHGHMIQEHDVPMIAAYPDKDEEGNDVPMDIDPKDMANVALLEEKTEEILNELTGGSSGSGEDREGDRLQPDEGVDTRAPR